MGKKAGKKPMVNWQLVQSISASPSIVNAARKGCFDQLITISPVRSLNSSIVKWLLLGCPMARIV